VSQRSPVSRQLRLPQDAEIIANYTNPSYVLGGWTPALAPLILAQPAAVTTTPGQPVTFGVKVAALPAASYQWFKNGAPIQAATEATLTIENVGAGDAAEYTVEVKNASGSVTSQKAGLVVK
jgi:hypothetical protein